ncbi:MAG: hypothetical protein AABX47_00980 [Nanoarchaeota archaeon]
MKEIKDAATRRVWEKGWKPAPFSVLEKMAKTVSKEIKTTRVTGKEGVMIFFGKRGINPEKMKETGKLWDEWDSHNRA